MPTRLTKSEKEKREAQRLRYERWYEKNKKKFNARRRKRYQTDEEYRERCIESSAATRERSEDQRKPKKKAKARARR